jgi:cytoskeletal protein RodZ
MDSIGDHLRIAREDRKIPVAQVARDTKINERYIVALEDGEFSILPAPAYAKGFLKIYAEYLGLDPRPLVEQYVQEHMGVLGQAFPAESEASVTSQAVGQKLAVIWIVVAAILAIAVVSGLRLWRSRTAEQPLKPAVSTEELETLPLPPLPQASPAVEPAAAATPPKDARAKQKKLAARVKESVWMKVYADGVLLFQGTVQKGKEEFWLAREGFDIRIAKPRLVDLSFDGKPVRDLKGKTAQNIFIDKDGRIVFYRGKMRSE